MDGSIWDLLNHGGYAMWVILVFSVLSVAVAIERAIVQWRFSTRAAALADAVEKCLAKGAIEDGRSACERSMSPLADVFLAGYRRLGRGSPESIAATVHRERQRVVQLLRARLWVLGTVGATAPFVGLFGTVLGIMSAMSGFEGEDLVRFSMVSGPISEALVVTAAGILVAVVAVIFFNFFNQRAARIAVEMKLLADEFVEQLLEARGNKEGKDGDREAA